MATDNEPIRLERRTYFRIVRTDPPMLRDFLSHAELGLTPSSALSPEERRQWAGISVFATHQQASRVARRFPNLGWLVAEIRLPDDADAEIRRTNRRSPGHHTLWAPAREVIQWVVGVRPLATPIDEEEGAR